MSANTSISEGGKGYPFGPVKCLMVEGDNGEFCPWYSEADRALDSLSVTQNGIYRASDRGVYGWNRVSVNVQADSVTGRDPETGEEKTVTVNPQTGELVEAVVPTEIRVTTLPTKTDYTNGETIDYSGIIVHAYSSTGQDMGEAPFNELVFPVTTAQIGDRWSDGQGLNAMKIEYNPHLSIRERTDTGEKIDERLVYVHGSALGTTAYEGVRRPASFGAPYNIPNASGTLFVTRYNGSSYFSKISGEGRVEVYVFLDGFVSRSSLYDIKWTGWFISDLTEYEAVEGEFTRGPYETYLTDILESTVNPKRVDPSSLHAVQNLPVRWPRPGVGAILETSFDINVTGGD